MIILPRSKLAAILLVCLFMIGAMGPLISILIVAESADIIITGNTVWQDQVIHSSGSIVIENGGNLTLQNTILIMNLTSNGEYNITVKGGGTLWIVQNSTMKSNSTYKFVIYLEPGSQLYIKNSSIQDIGYSYQPGLEIRGNSTHRTKVEVLESRIEMTGILVVNATVSFNEVNITSYSTNVDLFSIGEGSSIKLNATSIDFDPTITSTTTTLITVPLSLNAYHNESRLLINGTNITGSFYRLIQSQVYYKNLTVIINNSRISCTYSTPGLGKLQRNTLLHIENSKIEYQASPTPLFEVDEDNVVEIVNSTLINAYIYINWYKDNLKWGKINITDTILDYGIVSNTYYGSTLDKLYVENVSNSNGQKLILLRSQNTPITITQAENPYQIIILDSKGPVEAAGLTLNRSIQPVIASNSSLSLDSVNITVYDDDDTTKGYLPRIILSLNTTNLTIKNATLTSDTGYAGPAILFLNGGNLTIANTTVNVTREYFLKLEKETTGVQLFAKLVDSTIYIDSKVLYRDYTGENNAVMVIDNVTWIGYSSSQRDLTIGVSQYGKLYIVNSTFTDIVPIGLDLSSPSTLIRPYDYSQIIIVSSTINITNYPLVQYQSTPGVVVNLTGNNVTLNYGYSGDRYIIFLGSGNENGSVHIINNDFRGVPGLATSHIGVVYIDSASSNETVNVTGNRVEDCILGVVVGSNVKEGNSITIKNNEFTTMGGIIFSPGSSARQIIEGNTIAGEEIIYIAGGNNIVLEENATKSIGQIIIVDSKNTSIRNIVSNKENIMIQVINSDNTTINNITVKTTSGDYLLKTIMTYNSTNTKLSGSTINQTSHNGPYSVNGVPDGGIYIVNSTVSIESSILRLVDSIEGSRLAYIYYSNATLNNVEIILNAPISNPVAVEARYSNLTINNSHALLNGYLSAFTRASYASLVIANSNITDPDKGAGLDVDHSNVLVKDTLFYGYFAKALDLWYGTLEAARINVSRADDALYALQTGWINLYDSYLEGLVDLSTLENVHISNTVVDNDVYGSYGLRLYSVKNAFIEDSKITRPGLSTYWSNVYIGNSHNVTLVNVTVAGGGGNGIQLEYSSDMVIVNSNISLNKVYGIKVSSGSLTGYYLGIAGNGYYSTTTSYDGIYLSTGRVEIHYSNITGNYRLGAYMLQQANLSYNYWSSTTGPELLTSVDLADEIDPEEILDPSNQSLQGNKIIYDPFLQQPPIREKTPPTGWMDSPVNGSTVFGLVDIIVMGKDNEGVSTTIVFVDGRIEAVLYGTNQTYKWDSTTVPDGDHNITILTIDYSGNLDRKTYILHVANVHPYTEIIQPKQNYTYVGGVYTVKVFSSDNNPDRLDVYINGTLKTSWYGSNAVGIIPYSIYTTNYNDGDIVEVKFTLTDLDGYTSTSIVYLKIDNTDPTAILYSPANNSYVPEMINITFEVQDNLQFQRADVTINSTLVHQTTNTGIQTTTISALGYGYRTGDILAINLTSIDSANNTKTIIHYVTLDMELPSTQITDPANNTQVSGTVNLAFTASDNYGVTNVQIYINGTLVYNRSFTNTNTITDTYAWNTNLYTPGVYIVEITAVDVAGNTNTTTYHYYVTPTPVPEPGYIYIVVIIILAVLLVKYVTKTT